MNNPLARKKQKGVDILLLVVIALLVIAIYRQSDFKTTIRTQAQVPGPVEIAVPTTAFKFPTQAEALAELKRMNIAHARRASTYLEAVSGGDFTGRMLGDGDHFATLMRIKEMRLWENQPLVIPYEINGKKKELDLTNFGLTTTESGQITQRLGTSLAISNYRDEYKPMENLAGWEARILAIILLHKDKPNLAELVDAQKADLMRRIQHGLIESLRFNIIVAEHHLQKADFSGWGDDHEKNVMRAYMISNIADPRTGIIPRLANRIYDDLYDRLINGKESDFTIDEYNKAINTIIHRVLRLDEVGYYQGTKTVGVTTSDRMVDWYEKRLYPDLSTWNKNIEKNEITAYSLMELLQRYAPLPPK